MTPPPTSIDGTDITGATIDGQEVQEITVDGQVVFEEVTIPNSEADNKLIHRWHLSEDSDPFEDEFSEYPGINNGTSKVSGSFVDGAARSGDGSNDFINFSGSKDLDAILGDNHAWAFTLSTTDTNNSSITGVSDQGMWFVINIGANDRTSRSAPSGHLQFTLRENASGNVFTAETDVSVNDGNLHRIVVNKTAENDMEFYIDQSQVSRSITDSQGFIDTTNENGFDFTLFSFNNQSNEPGAELSEFLDGTIDDFCIFNDSLTNSEATSYSNPF